MNLTLTVLGMILDQAVEENLIASNPPRGIRRPKETRYEARPLTVAEARAAETHIADPFVRLAFVMTELLGWRGLISAI